METKKEKITDAHLKTYKECLLYFKVNFENGLNDEQVSTQSLKYGKNLLVGEDKNTILKIFLANVFNPMNAILGSALVVSIVILDWIKMAVLLIVIVTNSGIGFAQEFKSEKTMEALKKMSSPTAKVLRNSLWETIPSRDVVPGDIVSLETGDIVPADMRMVEAVNLETDEAFLTGESLPISKHIAPIAAENDVIPVGDRKNLCYMNSTVSKGRGVGVVINIGFDTEVGKIAQLVSEAGDQDSTTPLIRSLNNMMYVCAITALLLGVVVFAVNKFKWSIDVFLYAISVGIAILPEGLPAVITVALAFGMHRMSEQKALVRKLAAIEAVGQVTNVCSDKTGTLTEGKMVLKLAWLGGRHYTVTGKGIEPVGEITETETGQIVTDELISQRESLKHMLSASLLCVTSSLSLDMETKLWKAFGDPTEIALQVCAMKTGLHKEKVLVAENLEFAGEYPFDSSVKRMTTVYKRATGDYIYYTKGALERLLNLCDKIILDDGTRPLTDAEKEMVEHEMIEFASKGMRVLGIAIKTTPEFIQEMTTREQVENNLTLIGIVAIYDPPRAESLGAVRVCRNAGIVVHMATGDHHKTAEAIAREVGILLPTDKGGAPLVLPAVEFDKMTDQQIDELEELPRVLARCSPETKVKLIHALHRRNKYVAMTGDGVNDAPAVKKADIGIAMGIAGSDVTKQASEITLTDDNFATITLAIKEGRKLFTNATNIAQHLLSGNVSEVIVMVIGLAVSDVDGLPAFPMSAIQILWLNMVTSSPVALALGVEEAGKDVMKFPPRSKDSKLWTPQLTTDTMFFGSILGTFSLGSFLIYAEYYTDHGLGNIPAGCSKTYTEGVCDGLYEARAISFYVLSVLILVHGFNCRHNRYSMFMLPNQNKALWFAVLFGLCVTLPTAFIPNVNTGMFEQLQFKPIWWLWIILEVLAFILISEIYKKFKRRFYRPMKMSSTEEPNIVVVENK